MSFNTIASLLLQASFFVFAVKAMQDTVLAREADIDAPPSQRQKWLRALLTGLCLTGTALLATLLTLGLGLVMVGLLLKSPGAVMLLLFVLGKGAFLAAALLPFRLIFGVGLGKAFKAAAYATAAAVIGDLLVRAALTMLGATLRSRPWTMGLFLVGLERRTV
jgi:hypothetical protein